MRHRGIALLRADARHLPLADESVHAVICDPPYGIEFGNLAWDTFKEDPTGRVRPFPNGSKESKQQGTPFQVWTESWAREAYRVLKPGGWLVAFAAAKSYHRMACGVEDAGFDLRDMIGWVYASGFPKSTDASKQIDLYFLRKWDRIAGAFSGEAAAEIVTIWQDFVSRVKPAGIHLAERLDDSAQEPVRLHLNPENSQFDAVIAELKSSEAPLMSGESCSALAPAKRSTPESSALASLVAELSGSLDATRSTADSSAQCAVSAFQDVSTAASLRGGEALKTWLGRKPFSSGPDTDALCAALTEDLKRIILSQSKTFRNFDTTSQTACASAITVTTTASTAALLLSFTVATLSERAKQERRRATRSKIRIPAKEACNPSAPGGGQKDYSVNRRPWMIEAQERGYHETWSDEPATPQAAQWKGWGTALRPSIEPAIVARKPIPATLAANLVKHGTGALNVDGGRLPSDDDHRKKCESVVGLLSSRGNVLGSFESPRGNSYNDAGRWPPNVVCYGPELGGDSKYYEIPRNIYPCRKPSGREKRAGKKFPTVKPLDLMRWLVRLFVPRDGICLDPFHGSGTTLLSCALEGRCAIGSDLDQMSSKTATARLMDADALSQDGEPIFEQNRLQFDH